MITESVEVSFVVLVSANRATARDGEARRIHVGARRVVANRDRDRDVRIARPGRQRIGPRARHRLAADSAGVRPRAPARARRREPESG